MKRLFTLLLALTFFSFILRAQVVIYEVYGGGGSTAASGPAYLNDYLVLLNKSSSAVSLTGWSIQYTSTTGPSTGTWLKADIVGSPSIPANHFFLVKVSPDQNSSNTTYTGGVLPIADITLPTSVNAGGLTMAAAGGKIALVNNVVALTTTTPATSNIVDLVGWGAATFFEGTGPAPATTNASAVRRINNGQDTNNNVADFALNTTPTPLNSSSPAIPVELVDFKAQKANSSVKLAWSTASELNNARYDIERSSNGKEFEKIGEISGSGSTQEARTYTFMDEKPSVVNYYRLRQVDFDGTATLSKAVSVNFDKNSSIKVYPNVAKDKINIEINGTDGSADLTVVNLLGQVVKSQKVQNTEGSISLNINDLPNGSYIIRLISKSGEMTQRFEKQ